MMKRLGCLCSIGIVAAGCTSMTLDGLASRATNGELPGAGAGGASPASAAFSLAGSRFVAPSGSQFLIKGVNVNGQNWVWPGDVTRDVDYIADVWKFNFVRVNCLLAGEHFNDNNDVERIVDAFTARQVVVMLAPMDLGGADYFTETSAPSLATLVNWHRDLATRYRSNPYVWFQVTNGQGSCDLDPRWLEVHTQVVKAIRLDAKASNIIVADGMVWGTEDGCSGAAPVPADQSAVLTYGQALRDAGGTDGGNVAFSFQATDRWLPGGSVKMGDYLDRVQAKGFPILVSAYGAVGVQGADVRGATVTMFGAVEPRRVGRVAWHWYNASLPPAWENSLVTAPEGSTGAALAFDLAAPLRPTNLSWLGERVWDDTHR